MYHRPNLVYLCISQNLAYFRDGLFVVATKFFSKSKIVEHLHGANFLDYYNQSNWITKLFIDTTQHKIDAAIVLSTSLQFNFSKWLKSQNIYVVPNGIKKIQTEQRANQDTLPVLFFLGNFLVFKGIIDCIHILSIVKKRYPAICMNFGGCWVDDPVYGKSNYEIKNQFTCLVQEYDLRKNIILHGQVIGQPKNTLIQNSDILLYPTHFDAFPLVILEAMSAGKLVLSTKNVGAIDDIVENDSTGFLFTKGDFEGIAEKIFFLIENPDVLQRMQHNALKRFYMFYTIDEHIKKMNITFDQILMKV